MIHKKLLLGITALTFFACKTDSNTPTVSETYPDIAIVRAMKNVMWDGALDGAILLDTIANKNGLYGLGPKSFLTGELTIFDGHSYVSKVTSDSTMVVEESYNVSAPFFVHANIQEWETIELPTSLKTLTQLELFIDSNTKAFKRPFTFKMRGKASKATIHIQNLPEGSKVSSPKEAHQGQVNYPLENETVDIVGFFSTEHQGIFTHHDSFMHMHLITQDRKKMGHLDDIEIENMVLYLPKL
ncbi:acetolactate decarboxylase [Mangrovimonas sp. DI 80]|uniref:acetolactate decarboxylase n=1 Tax=Mangrovimonas sp. DI 80 TaxID=1779330 RepID=UPI0009780311|nr:acetolactate decarboxylase [Mangrovimonas sp. DI 80]OMP30527.1 alpha-acetolactate decarboxylase [Mangrovimonas sp. DI 80]